MSNEVRKVLVWNRTQRACGGAHQGTTVRLRPGLNLFSAEWWGEHRIAVEPMIDTGEIEELGSDVLAMDPLVLVAAIEHPLPRGVGTTALHVAALRWIERSDTRPAVRAAVTEVIAALF